MRVGYVDPSVNNKLTILLLLVVFLIASIGVYFMLGFFPAERLHLLVLMISLMLILSVVLAWQPKIVMPLLVIGVMFSPDIVIAEVPGRMMNLRIEDGLIVASLIGLLLRESRSDSRILPRTPLDLPILTFCTVSLISTAIGVYLGNVSLLRGVLFWGKRVEYFVLFYLMCRCLEGEREIRSAVYLIFICLLISAIYNTWMRIKMGRVGIEQWRAYAIPGSEGRSTEYGEILVLALPIILAVTAATRKLTHIGFGVLAVPLMSFLLLDTLRRSAFVGVAIALILLAGIRYRFLFIPLAGGVYYAAFHLPERIMERIIFLWEELAYYPKPGGSFPIRVAGVKQAISEFLYRPLLGRGLGTYGLATSVSHNQYAQLLLEGGILGLASFAWLIGRAFRLCRDLIAHVPGDEYFHGYALGYGVGLVGWLVMNLGTISFTSIRTMEAFILMTALLVAMHRVSGLSNVDVPIFENERG